MTDSPLPSNTGARWSDGRPSDPWASRWTRLARPLDLAPHTPVALALSGGADSVFLLHLLARSEPRPKVLAIHVDHGLRGEESRADAEFCARACAKLGIPFSRRIAEVDPEASDLEARCRKARYAALAEETRGAGIDVLLTGHHEDDAVETLLMRWMRGTELSGLAGLRRETVLGTAAVHEQRSLRVLRPLVALRREEVRSALRNAGVEWREDSSNDSHRFTRNRVRHQVLPEIEARCGTEGVENFFEFARSVESLEDELADRTAHIQWEDAPHAAARGTGFLGGVVRRDALQDLAPPLLRRAIGRLIGEGTGQRPGRDVLARIASDVTEGHTGRRQVHGGWSVQIKGDGLHLNPPVQAAGGATAVAAPPQTSTQRQTLQVPGSVTLPDGRTIHAALADDDVVDAGETVAVLDADAVGLELGVRFERPGDRVHPLGAPGHKPLRRFLGEAGVPREERGNVPIVVAGEEVVWVAGIRPAEPFRVTAGTRRRLRLTLA
ncbi:MAG: tRNA lysidine(34) synthetase TilS [Planctomycetota bacterium]